ncbi:MAG TPA: hypothetical protein VFU31_03275 [Candidatus Binatia bacterium]|nr:hypothetical protein [Candidatus Binatia bacterium]
MKRRTGTFTARGDDRRNYTIHIYTDLIDSGSHYDARDEVDGKELRTADGLHVNFINQGIYTIVATGVTLRL